MYSYLVQRIYEDEPVNVGPFTGYYFTGWHRVTRYDGTKPHRYLSPPHVDDDSQGTGYEVRQINLQQSENYADTQTQTEAFRKGVAGTVLYGKPLYWGLAKIKQMMRQSDLLSGPEGAGD